MVNTLLLYSCVPLPKIFRRGENKKHFSVTSSEGSLFLLLNHLVLCFKGKNWITVKILLFSKLQEMLSDVGERDF